MSEAALLRITVLWPLGPHDIRRADLQLPAGATVAEAVKASALLEGVPSAQVDALVTAVWGKACAPEQALRDRDRVELLRGLQVDPKEARRQRYRRDGLRRAPRG